jgi:hypothetical protein
MLGTPVRILAAIAVAASLAAPVSAHLYKKKQLEAELVELRGEVLGFVKPKKQDEPSYILLLIKNSNHKGAKRNGENRTWHVSVDKDLMKVAGLTQATLIKDKEITIAGYRVADDLCSASGGRCYFAARLIKLDNGCTSFVGKAAPVFGSRTNAWAWNVPDDGLEKSTPRKCYGGAPNPCFEQTARACAVG